MRTGKPLIVVVEDEFLLRVSLAKGIDDAGYSVMSAATGDEGLNLLRGGRADLAIIDLVLPGRLDGLYTQIRSKATQAWVVVVGNPRLFNGSTCAASLAITPEEQSALNEAADLLAETTKGVAASHGFAFADPRDAFAGHEVCSADPYILGYVPGSNVESFHPTRTGQDAYTDVVLAKL